jgi:tetratricopeptide (TPR) repeat protein
VLYEEAFRSADTPYLRSNALNNLAHLRYTHAGSDYTLLRETVADYQKALEWNERNVDAWFNLGKSLEDLGLAEQARQAFARVLQLDDAHPGAHLNMGNYHFVRVRHMD